MFRSSLEELKESFYGNTEEGPTSVPCRVTAPHRGLHIPTHQEDVYESFLALPHKEIHTQALDRKDTKGALPRTETTAKCISTLAKGMGVRQLATMVCDFKEGYLEKQSRSLLDAWKRKYCRVGHSQFLFYRNLDTGLLSGLIDFRKVQTLVTSDKPARTFT